MVDLALLFAELLRAPGVTQADLGRRYRKSPGYVSVVCRLGRALHPLPPEARDALRVPHFTLKAAQALVGRHKDPAMLRAAAARLAASPPAGLDAVTGRDGRAGARTRARQGVPGQWDRAPDGPDPIDPLPEPPDAMSRRTAFVYTWDDAAARRDPRAVLAEFETFVRAATDEVVTRLRHIAGDLGPAPSTRAHLGSTSPTADGGADDARPDLGRSTEGDVHAAPGTFAGASTGGLNETALRRLDARVAEMLRAHRVRLNGFLAERARDRERGPLDRAPRSGPGRGGTLPPVPVDPAELDADTA